MVQPATGTTWKTGGFGDTDPRFLERGGKIAALFRQARGPATNISPHNANGTINFNPFAQDDTLRDDLFAFRRVNGFWVANQTTNEGWHLGGAFKEGDGPTVKSKVDDDDYMIEQSNRPYDSDRVKEDEPFSLTPVDTLRPVIRRIRNGLPLADENGNNLVEYPGLPNAGWGQPVDYTPVEYQVLLFREFRRGGKSIRTVKGYSLVKNNDIGDAKMGKKEAEAAELTFKPLPDGIFMAVIDGEFQPVIKYEWVGGDGWDALYGSPVSQFTVTLGTQSSGTFTLTFGGLTTGTIAYNAANSVVKAALVALDDGFDTTDWSVSGSAGGPYTVTTPGAQYGALTGSGASLGTPGTFVIAPVV